MTAWLRQEVGKSFLPPWSAVTEHVVFGPLSADDEAVAAGAATWCKTGAPGEPTPSLDDIEQYVAAYEEQRGRPLTVDQHKALRAAAAPFAYTARCEHALDPHEETWTTTRARLRNTLHHLI